MIVVVDASVVAKWFLREELHTNAMSLLEDRDVLHAPDLVITELTNVFWRKCNSGELTLPDAEAALSAVRVYLSILHPTADFAVQALKIGLALEHPVYDCLYLACAQQVDGVVVTADRRLLGVVRQTPYHALVRPLADVTIH